MRPLPCVHWHRPCNRRFKHRNAVKEIALVIAVLLGFAGTAHGQDQRRANHYVQRTDHYSQVFNYWASQLRARQWARSRRLLRWVGDRGRHPTHVQRLRSHRDVSFKHECRCTSTHFAWDMMP